MAEPVVLPFTGSGDATSAVAVDDAGAAGVVQILKLAISADGSAVLIPGDGEGLYVQTLERAEDPQQQVLLASALAAGASTDLNAADIATGKTGRLMAVDLSSSVPCRCDVQTVSGARVTRTVLYARAGDSRLWRPPGPTFVELAGGTGIHFGAAVTNLSPSLTADVRAVLYWDEV